MANKFSSRQTINPTALPMVGSSANEGLDSILGKIDPELSKGLESFNLLLTDGGLITYDGASLTFTEALNVILNQKVSGASPQTISLGSSSRAFSATGKMLYAVLDRTAGTATVTADATSLPAASSANQEVILIAKRVDAADGTKRIYWRNGMGQNEGQTLRLGAAGAGSGTGTNPTPAPGYKWLEYDTFDVNKTNSASKVDSTNTNATYSAAKQIYQISADRSKTVSSNSGTALTVSGAPSFTVAAGDVVFYPKYTRRMVAVGAGATNALSYSDDDGKTWTGAGGVTKLTIGRAVVFNGSKFVAGGTKGTDPLIYSTDGITWTSSATQAVFSTSCTALCWNGSIFVAGGAGTNTLAWSTDGITWTGLGTSIFSTSCSGIAWTGTRFIATGTGTNTLAYSSDGITWTANGATIFTTNGNAVAWNGSIAVAGGLGTNTLAYSSDGITWTGLGTTVFTTAGLSVAWNGLKFLAGSASGTTQLANSKDGINWQVANFTLDTSLTGLCFNGNRWVATTDSTGGSNQQALYSDDDGTTWTLTVSGFGSGGGGKGLASSPAPYMNPGITTLVTLSSNAAAGQWRKIASVTSQTVYTLDAAFSVNATASEKLVISQAVWTKDLVNFGSSTERTRARDYYTGNITDAVVDYNDSLTASDDVSDKGFLNRVMMSSSNSGLVTDTATPTSDKYVATLQRPFRAETIPQHVLNTNTIQQRLFLTFFADPYNPDVITTCNLLNYQASFFNDGSGINSGVLEDALCFSDNSTTPHNCTVATSGGFTSVSLDWSYIPNIRNGDSQIEVFVDGKRVQRFISSVKTPSSDLNWTEQVDGSGLYKKITFNNDLSTTPLEIKVLKRFGVNQDISVASTAKLNALFDFVVGSATQVAAGIATHSTLTDAITAAVNGQNILVLNNVTITDSVTLNKKLSIVGKGNGSSVTGSLTVTSAGAKSIIDNMRFSSSITFNAGANFCYGRLWQANGQTFSNDVSNTSNIVTVITE